MDISQNEQSKQTIKEKKREMLLKMIMRQTNYTEEEAIQQLKKWHYNSIHVMKAYLNPDFQKKKAESQTKSTNQRMMKEIRTFCDKGTRVYYLKKELQRQQEILKSVASEKENVIINI